MNYELRFDEKAISFLEKLPVSIRQRIFSKLLRAKQEPHHFFQRLEGRADYKLRVGDYRVIAEIDDANHIIHVTLAGHRKNVYETRN
jgi:mRNA interferase RelE/StbE